MTPLTSACLCVTLLFVCVVDLASSAQKLITSQSGQDVMLTCAVPRGKTIRAVKWSRDDLGDKYVLLYKDEQLDPEKQHPSFKNRVDLQDRQMKNGDVSLILKNVINADNGSYKCCVFVGESASWEIMGTVNMSVLPPGQTGGDTEAGSDRVRDVFLFFYGVLFGFSVVVLCCYGICKWKTNDDQIHLL